MGKITIAVGSTRRPKLGAVEAAVQEFGPAMGAKDFEIVGYQVESGVSHTPVSREEAMRGARRRAEGLRRLAREKSEVWQYFVGLEGGLDVLKADGRRRVLLESWAYVTDGTRGYYGRSGGVEIPAALEREVLQERIELGVAIDRFAGTKGIRDGQGAWGVLSKNLITRQEAFRVAVLAAFAPFYNRELYSKKALSMGTKTAV